MRFIFSLLICFVLLFAFTCPCSGLTSGEQDRAIERLNVELQYGGEYDWGSNNLKKQFPNSWQIKRLEKGAPGDCSSKMQAVYYWLGKFVRRCTARDMADRKYGWKGKYVAYRIAPKASLVFFTFKPERENGHVGALMKNTKDHENVLAHASSSKNKFVSSRITANDGNVFWDKMTLVLELD